MKFASTPIAGVWQVHTEPRADARGSFTRLYCAEAFDVVMPGLCFVQANLSHTLQRGTLRGLHLQRAPAQEYKLVRCLRGHVFDVAADLRPLSATYGQWFALELSDRNHCQLLIPPGVAHGFQALSDDVQLLYQHSTRIRREAGRRRAPRRPEPGHRLAAAGASAVAARPAAQAAARGGYRSGQRKQPRRQHRGRRMKCRHCATPLHAQEHLFIDLGSAPPSNAFLRLEDLDRAESHFPLKVLACPECRLVQVDEVQRHDALFDSDYVYFSSFSSSWLAHARDYVALVSRRLELGTDSRVMEVASNDGYLLQYFAQRGVPCVGVEPTESTARAARAKGIESIGEFFGGPSRSASPPSEGVAIW